MQLEDYFEFEKFETPQGSMERIRIKGHAIKIENVIDSFNVGLTAGQIQRRECPELTLEQVFATLTYYLHNKADVDAYIERGRVIEKAWLQDYLKKERPQVVNGHQAITAVPERASQA